MANKKARALDEANLQVALARVSEISTTPDRDRLMILMTFRLGLRIQEVVYTHLEDILTPDGKALANVFHVTKRAGKYGKERDISLTNPELRKAIEDYVAKFKISGGPLFWDRFGKPLTPNAAQKQISHLFRSCGLHGCTSHSGRRSLANRFLKRMHEFGATIKDLQDVLGHADLETTEAYIDRTERTADLLAAL